MQFMVKFILLGIIGFASLWGDQGPGVFTLVKSCIEQLPTAPEAQIIIDAVEKKASYLERGNDDLRVKFVTLQGIIEHALTCASVLGQIKDLQGIIHTPAPATPLCAPIHEIDLTLLDPSIRHDLKKLLTVQSRAHIMRQYLHQRNKLYVVYPSSGMEKRSPDQQKEYREMLKRFSGHLVDCPLKINTLNEEMVGALYLFRNNEGKRYAFSIKSKQAIDPSDDSEWGIWFGPIDRPVVKARVETVLRYFDSIEGPHV